MNVKQSALLLAHWGGDHADLTRDLRRQFPRLTVAQASDFIDEAVEKLRVRDAEIDRLADAEEARAREAEHDLSQTMHEEGDATRPG